MLYLEKIKFWWESRAINKIRDQYRYTLEAYANKHTTEKTSDNIWLIIGLGAYIGTLILSPLLGLNEDMSFYVSMGVLVFALVAPIALGLYEAYELAKKLTLTIHVIANNPEETRPYTLRLMGVEFGAPMQSKEEIFKYLKDQNMNLTITAAELDAQVARVEQEALNRNMRVYPMMAKGDNVPSLTLFPDDPEKMLRARKERVRLSYDWGSVRHATLYALECKPVKTSIQVKEKIIDVEYALFAPFITQHSIDKILEKSEWHVPNRSQQEFATYVKQQADMTKNASFFGTLEKQRDDAAAAYDRLILHQQFQDIQTDVEGDVLARFKPKRTYNDMGMYIIFLIIGVLVGILLP